MKTFLKIDYKDKWFIIQDELFELDWGIGTISKEEALKPEFITEHRLRCLHYGIPAYIGKDKEMNKVYKF